MAVDYIVQNLWKKGENGYSGETFYQETFQYNFYLTHFRGENYHMIQSGITNFMTGGSHPRDIVDGNINLLDLIPSDSVMELVLGNNFFVFCHGFLLFLSGLSGGKFLYDTLKYVL